MLQIVKDRETTILAAGATELLGASGLDVGSFDKLSFILFNTGGVALTNLSVYWLDGYAGTDWSPADGGVFLPGGVLNPGAGIEITVTDLVRAKMRMTVTGAAGQTVRLTLSASWR